MSKPCHYGGPGLFFLALSYAILLFLPIPSQGQDAPPAASSTRFGTLVNAQVERARGDLERTERLVEDGTLPRVKLNEARVRLSDAEDEAALTQTLYGFKTAQNMTEREGNDMVAAARRRVDRATVVLEDRKRLLDSGAIARQDLENAESDLADRQRTLRFAEDRIRLLKELAAMAETERQLARNSEAHDLKNSMVRFNGNGLFSLSDLTPIEVQFQKKFHRSLPISALGQTLTHQSLGLDHRNRVDVALSPTQPEGVWLLALLERLHVPYLAFRNAVAGAATAPHIHIGVGSTRLRAGLREEGHAVYSRRVR